MSSISVACIGIVVRDLEACRKAFETLCGIDTWHVRSVQAVAGMIDGTPFQTTYSSARATLCDGCDIELIQPAPDGGSFYRQLLRHGEGVHHLEVAGEDSDLTLLAARLSRERVPIRQEIGVERWFDTRDHLGGWILKTGAGRFTDVVERTPGRTWMRPRSLVHLGVVVHDVFATTRAFAMLLGINRWTFDDWRTGPKSLTNSQYRGAEVDHGYISAIASLGSSWFEIVEPTVGPSHYRDDFLARRGQGVHHLYLTETENGDEWDRLHADLDGFGLISVMGSALLGDVADFSYIDTGDRLGGITLEIARMRPGHVAGEFVPTFSMDYSEALRITGQLS